MRRHARTLTSALAAVATGLLLAVTVAAPASAANGELIINGETHVDPHGCIPLEGYADEIVNHTDSPAVLYEGYDCQGRVMETVAPGGETFNDWAYSLRIN